MFACLLDVFVVICAVIDKVDGKIVNERRYSPKWFACSFLWPNSLHTHKCETRESTSKHGIRLVVHLPKRKYLFYQE